MSQSPTEHLLVPVASGADARATATELTQYPFDRITVVTGQVSNKYKDV